MDKNRLTTQRDWDDIWDDIDLPLVYQKGPRPSCIKAILEVFDKWLPRVSGLSALEIGGSVGGYLAYMHKNFGYQVCCLDYSPVGCAKTRENFRLLGINGRVIQEDLSDDVPITESFDVVYSMGFVEHFSNLDAIIERHLKFLKPGGILIIGVPCFLGINLWLMRRLAPRRLSQHKLSAMEISEWTSFEKKFGLKRVFRKYIGGFMPTAYSPCESFTLWNRIMNRAAHSLEAIFRYRLPIFNRLNARCISCYALGIWKKP